jgi:pyruvate/2-oxoglutarate dehydrogenase complex dihydrolipoamide dehydrogenase (E3) component
MSADPYDLVVIGSGSAGSFAAREAASTYGKRVAVIEKLRWGGDCMTVACKPTKTYLTSAELYYDVRERGSELGVLVDDPRLDFGRVKARKDKFVAESSGEARKRSLREHGCELYDGLARFLDPNTIQVGDDRLETEYVLLANGSLPAEPPIDGIDGVEALTNETILDLTEIPESLLIVGAGAVGVEFGQMFSRFGSKVTIVEFVDRILPRMDGDAAAALREALEREGVTILTGAKVEQVEPAGGRVRATVATVAGERQVEAERLLNAVGRRPDVDGLDLESAGVRIERQGIPIDSYCETKVKGIFAAGDITGVGQFTPVANYQGRLAVRNMFSAERLAADYRALPAAVFTDPEVAGAGPSEDEAREQGLGFDVASAALRNTSRANFSLRKDGLIKLLYEPGSGRVIAAHLVSPTAGDVIQVLSVAIRLGVTIDDLAGSIHVYPTFAEIVKGAAEQAVPAPARA